MTCSIGIVPSGRLLKSLFLRWRRRRFARCLLPFQGFHTFGFGALSLDFSFQHQGPVLKVGDFPQPRIFVKEMAVTLRRKHTRVMRADGLESVGVLFSGEIAHCIAAAKREGIS